MSPPHNPEATSSVKNAEEPNTSKEMEQLIWELRSEIAILKEEKEALQKSETKFHLMADFANDWEEWVAPDGSYLYVSPSCERLTGYTAEEFVADPGLFHCIVHPEDKEILDAHIRNDHTNRPEFRIITKHGETRWLIHYCQQVHSADNIFLGWRGTNRDITKRKLMELELRQKQTELQALFDHSPAGMVLFDARPPYTVLTHNKYYQELFAEPYRSQGMVGLNVYEYAPEVEAAGIVAAFEEVVRKKKPLNLLDFPYNSNPPNESWYDWHMSPIILDDQVVALVSISIDVTDLHKAKEVRQEIEEHQKAAENAQAERQRLFDVLETLPTMVYLLRPDYQIAFANRSFRERFGEPRDQTCYTCCFGLSEPCGFCETYRVLETGEPHQWNLITPDGSTLDIYNFPFTDVDGSPLILEMGIDITRQKRAEESLRKTSQYARSLIEASLDPLVTISIEGKITDVNDATVKATGVSREKLIGTDFSSYFTEPEKARAGYQQVFAEGHITNYPLTIHGKDNRLMDVLYNATVYHDTDGNIAGVFAAARDVTERKHAEESLRKTSQYARSLIEASLDPLVTISIEGKITDVNDATVKATGVSREELIGTDFSSYFTEPEKARAGYVKVFAEGHVSDYPLTIRSRDGHLMDVLYNATVYHDIEGNVEGVFAAARDVTERKRTEEELAKYRDHLEELVKERTEALKEYALSLKQSNEDLEQFAYIASHDLQEPLRTVVSFSQLLRRRYGNKLGKDADEYIGFIVDAGTRMQAQIHDLLEYSRVSTRGREITRVESEIVLEEAEKDLRTKIRRSGAIITHDPLPAVLADASQLRQVFQNLLSNAIKFSQIGTVPEIHVAAKSLGDRWQFSVRDKGIGIAPEFTERIFVIFQRLHTRTEYPGTGIGLAICKKIIGRHGGEIWVESEPSVGSTFYFTLPAAD